MVELIISDRIRFAQPTILSRSALYAPKARARFRTAVLMQPLCALRVYPYRLIEVTILMNDPVQFTATYKHYQMTAQRFTSELDRLTDQGDLIQGESEKTSKSAQDLLAIAARIEGEVERALAAWSDGSSLIEDTAEAARNAATSGVIRASDTLIAKISEATDEARNAVIELREARVSARWRYAMLALAFLAGSAATYAVARFGFDIGVESETRKAERQQSQYFSRFWGRASDSEKQRFEKVMARKLP